MSMNVLENRLHKKLEERRKIGNFRQLSQHKGLVDFVSNDYLGLSRSAELAAMIKQEYDSFSTSYAGSTGSRLLSGNSAYAQDLECRLACTFKAEAALLFNSGYAANLALLSTIPQKGDTIIYDELSHACLKDGARLSFADRFSFKHNDMDDLERKLQRACGEKFIVVESVYSMDGDSCPLLEIVRLKQKYGAYIIIDEAHSTGIMGKDGSGMACALGLEQEILASIYTFGKAMGVHGACIAGSQVLGQFLINFARPFIYTTAMSLHSLVSISNAFSFLQNNLHLQQLLKDKRDFFNQLFLSVIGDSSCFRRIESQSAIQALVIGGNEEVKMKSASLMAHGFDVRPILSPTVKKGEERLRICLHTYNTEQEIERLIHALKNSI
jgi:8-amino-7-oxononanoate synthase